MLVGGDFNMSPGTILDSGFPGRLPGQIISPSCDGTCSATGGMKLTVLFVAAKGLAKAAKDVSVQR
eukprot:6033680-Pyramimonas_sp.AAC.1